jgi:DNA topoisomerase VI subunit A
LCIENLTTFYEFLRAGPAQSPGFAALCTLGNPAPSIRRLLRLVPNRVPIYLWADLDYGGFNILSQLRQLVRADVKPFHMDIATFDAYSQLARPLTENDARHLKRLAARPELQDVLPVIQHLLHRRLKLEQEAISI